MNAMSPPPRQAVPVVEASRVSEEKGAGRWTASFIIVAGLHAAAGVGVLALRAETAPPPPPGAVMIDLAPEPVAPPQPEATPEPPPPAPAEPPPPEPPPPEPPPEPEPPPPEPPPPEPEPPEPPPKPEVVIPPKPEPPPKKIERKVEKPRPPKPKEVAQPSSPSPPVQAPTEAPVAASSAPSQSVRTWQSTLLAHLERHKRYPRMAQARREQGVAYVRFAMDREGKVIYARLERGSGYVELDEETVALVQRAQPLPPPPEGDGRGIIELVAPVRYALR